VTLRRAAVVFLAAYAFGAWAMPTMSRAVSVKAFPSAEGFGAGALGGRAGSVCEVTSLADSGAGTLRDCVERSGARTVVFRLGGTITLKKTLTISKPYITIAGQTAPGGGIALKNDPSNAKPSLDITTHDVIVRFLRVRPGLPGGNGGDGVRIDGPKSSVFGVVLDHCSVSWATDENVQTGQSAHDMTIQWSIVSEGIRGVRDHSRGLLNASTTPGDDAGVMSVHHDLFAHNTYRNPQISGGGQVQTINNVVYNYDTQAMSTSNSTTNVDVDVIKESFVENYVKKGPDSDSVAEIKVSDEHKPRPDGVNPTFELYVSDSGGIRYAHGAEKLTTLVKAPTFPQPAWPVTTQSASSAYTLVLNGAGATKPLRDSVDARIVDDVKKGTGHIIDDPKDVGGYPTLSKGTPYTDSDHDGMSDSWEKSNGLNPNDASDGSKVSSNGYTNLENFINSLAGDQIP
jgi:hypothetical protein